MFRIGNHKQVIEGKPNLSKWTLRYSAFGQNFEFSWLARLLKVITSISTIQMCNLKQYVNSLHFLLTEMSSKEIQEGSSEKYHTSTFNPSYPRWTPFWRSLLGYACWQPIQNQKIHWRSVDGLANRWAFVFISMQWLGNSFESLLLQGTQRRRYFLLPSYSSSFLKWSCCCLCNP